MRPLAAWFAALLLLGNLEAATPSLLQQAFDQWVDGREDLAFTQRSRVLADSGKVEEERLERYDPSLPDNQRWKLIEVNGKPPSPDEKKRWEGRRNGKPRKKPIKPPSEYLDLENARLTAETPVFATYELSFRPDALRLVQTDKLSVVVRIEKGTGQLHLSAILREPLRIALGLAKITDIDLDVAIEQGDGNPPEERKDVGTASTARIMLSKFGSPTEYTWTDFKRVKSFQKK